MKRSEKKVSCGFCQGVFPPESAFFSFLQQLEERPGSRRRSNPHAQSGERKVRFLTGAGNCFYIVVRRAGPRERWPGGSCCPRAQPSHWLPGPCLPRAQPISAAAAARGHGVLLAGKMVVVPRCLARRRGRRGCERLLPRTGGSGATLTLTLIAS